MSNLSCSVMLYGRFAKTTLRFRFRSVTCTCGVRSLCPSPKVHDALMSYGDAARS